MKLGIIIYSTDAEEVWNAFRLGVYALKQGDNVKIFLLAKGVECEKLNAPQFNVPEQMREFVEYKGHILACGTCLKLRNSNGSELCPLSTLKDLYALICDADKIVTI